MARISRAGPGIGARAGASLLLAGFAGLFGCDGQSPQSPNLVLISVDRLAADRLGCFGGVRDAGGSICALGEAGTLFAWVVSSNRAEASGAATILTGLPQAVHGVGGDGQSFLADRQPSIAEELRAAGYATAAFIASPRVNRSRRLDQGFDLYDDRLGSPSRSPDGGSVELSEAVRAWIRTTPEPWFVWIHADRDAGLVELDRLLSRLSQTFEADPDGPGILFVALRGESESPMPSTPAASALAASKIDWRSHRVPLVWRPPVRDGIPPPAVSFRLAGLIDVPATLRGAAHASGPVAREADATQSPGLSAGDPRRPPEPGRDLSRASISEEKTDSTQGRTLVIEASTPGGEVGLASTRYLYARRPSALDGTGRPLPTAQLRPLDARFARLPEHDPIRDPTPNSARIDPPEWRRDVLDSESPVPRLEFHLARGLAELEAVGRIGAGRDPKELP